MTTLMEAGGEYRLRFIVEPSELAGLRRRVAQQVRLWGIDAVVDATLLCMTELVTNVHRHADGRCALRLTTVRDGLVLVVSDLSRAVPVLKEPDWESGSGRGIFLVEHHAKAWSVVRTATGKDVWCLIPGPGDGRAAGC
ncbi:hypothetical protein SRB5_59920 [Streptomyces sp. RB5]|uniref:Histidine kinase/HSP90-like ATPase domain-containing protein n=1 Tax=Streptomyces smaragdinus TaxID=2585196 RepID=A0A7K0CQX0_9ACTN|nr:ATP-binding protein [Streptomyces smaragdinus]MQY15801.1 hypothetical protein [Streptomyces smaragdinus]